MKAPGIGYSALLTEYPARAFWKKEEKGLTQGYQSFNLVS